jgi:hypothetical protein
MSYAKPERRQKSGVEAAGAIHGDDKFLEEVADGLHALAQPLSILRSAVELIAISHQDRYVNVAAQQLDRTSKIFSALRNLVDVKRHPARSEAIDLRELIAPIAADWKASLDAFGIGLAVHMSEQQLSAVGDAERMEQTVMALLEAAASDAARGDRLEMRLLASDGWLECSLENCDRKARHLNSVGRLHLAVARENMQSQNGRFEFCDDPFCIRVSWLAGKTADEEPGNAALASRSTKSGTASSASLKS